MHIKEKTNIVQANYLIENRPKFTKDETRLFLTIVGTVNKDDDDFKPIDIPVSDFAELWGMDNSAAYRKIKTALHGLIKKDFFIEGINQNTGKMRFLSISYLSMATYEEGEGYATVEISPSFKPYLLALKKNYTKYVLENILNLSTVNAIRNYELLKQFEGLGSRTFTIEEYKKKLGIENKYSRNTDLRVYVIEPAKEEINANTDIYISYEIVGRGKKARIIFTILPNQKKKVLPISAESPASDDNRVMDSTDERLLPFIPEECQTRLPEIRQLVIDCLKGGDKVMMNIEERDTVLCDILNKFNAMYQSAKSNHLINKSAAGWYVTVLEKQIEQGKFNSLINEPKKENSSKASYDIEELEKIE